jgi:hypothetical protein
VALALTEPEVVTERGSSQLSVAPESVQRVAEEPPVKAMTGGGQRRPSSTTSVLAGVAAAGAVADVMVVVDGNVAAPACTLAHTYTRTSARKQASKQASKHARTRTTTATATPTHTHTRTHTTYKSEEGRLIPADQAVMQLFPFVARHLKAGVRCLGGRGCAERIKRCELNHDLVLQRQDVVDARNDNVHKDEQQQLNAVCLRDLIRCSDPERKERER